MAVGSHKNWHPDDPNAVLACPYGQPGDRLWVRETFSAHGAFGDAGRIKYRADFDDGKEPHGLHWKPSIFCTRKASRITLEVASVRVERLKCISEENAKAEGALFHDGRPIGHHGWRHDVNHSYVYESARESYMHLWQSINGAGSWAANPWVWVIEFRRVQP